MSLPALFKDELEELGLWPAVVAWMADSYSFPEPQALGTRPQALQTL